MQNADIDELVFSKICEGISKAKLIVELVPPDFIQNSSGSRTVDNSLRRLRAKGVIKFINSRWWTYDREGKMDRLHWEKNT